MAKININEEQIRQIIAETAKKILNEGMNPEHYSYSAWEYLMQTLGPEEMLNSIFKYANSRELDEYIDCFRQDGYLDDFDNSHYEDEDY